MHMYYVAIQYNSSNIDIFNKHRHIYDKTLKHGGYRQAIEFIPPKDKSKHRSRNIIWFNPSHNKCITSNIGKDFLNLICKDFLNNTPQAKIFNKNNIKVGYRRCPWCNGYRRRKWTRRHEFKSWTKLIAFHIALIPWGKVWIQLFSLQQWVNSNAD